MSLEAVALPRKFVMKEGRNDKPLILDDPDPNMSTGEVLSHYSAHYPEFTTATVGKPKVEDDAFVYEIETTVGTKG